MYRSKYLILEIQIGRTKDDHYIYKRPEIDKTINRKLDETFNMFLERVMNFMADEKGYKYHSTLKSKIFGMALVFELDEHRRGKV